MWGCRAMLRTERADAGFTLIEALVALAVVAISIGAIATLMGSTARGTRQLEGHVVLVQAAAAALWSGLPARNEPVPTTLSGEANRQAWRADFDPIDTPLAVAGDSKWLPVKVTLHVVSPSGTALRVETVRMFKRPDNK